MVSSAQPNAAFVIVKNMANQYSIWPSQRPVPDGWILMGKSASRESCLEQIRSLWTDMRPKSAKVAETVPSASLEPTLISKLTAKSQSFVIWTGGMSGQEALQTAARTKYLQLQFTEFKGNPTIIMHIDGAADNLADPDFSDLNAIVEVNAYFTLDDVRCRCLAKLSPASMAGTAQIDLA